MLHLAIIRSSSTYLDINSYNVQEIGLAKALMKLGVSVDIYMAGKSKEVEISELNSSDRTINIYRLPTIHLPGQQGVFMDIIRLLNESKYDLVQVHELDQLNSVALINYCRKRQVPVILSQGMYQDYSGIHKRLVQFFFEKTFLSFAIDNTDFVICKTARAEGYMRHKGFKKTAVLPVGLDQEKFKDFCQLNWKKILNIPQDGKVLLYVGVIEPRRNVEFIIKLMALLNRKNIHIYCIIVGNGPNLNKCKTLVNKLGLDNSIKFVNKVPQSHVPSLYLNSDIFVLPSKYEIFGMVIMESMFFGLPVISSETPGAIDLIDKDVNGCIIGSFDLERWTQVIIEVVQNSERLRSLSTKAFEKANAGFTWDSIAENYLKVYQNVISGFHPDKTSSAGRER